MKGFQPLRIISQFGRWYKIRSSFGLVDRCKLGTYSPNLQLFFLTSLVRQKLVPLAEEAPLFFVFFREFPA